MADLQKEQPRNITDKEVAIIQSVFTEEILKSMRALFFGLPITKLEKDEIKGIFADPMVMAIVYKRFYPTLDKDTPIGQVQDVWLGAEQMVFGAPPDTVAQALGYKELSLKYTLQALALLKNPDGEGILVEYSPKKYLHDPLGIVLLGRNQFIRHVEQQLLFLWLIAQTKATTPEEVKKKKQKDSSQ